MTPHSIDTEADNDLICSMCSQKDFIHNLAEAWKEKQKQYLKKHDILSICQFS